ncbi:MAG: outer membrane beta-barrel protein, partial [Planctomycetales bacterium]|nr:outer membrane beta-barrel protein [Planctomycetales bacterium]
MRLRPTLASLTLVLTLLAMPFATAGRAQAQDDQPSTSSASTSRGGRIIRTSSRSRITTADRLAAYQDAAIDAPAVPEMADDGPIPPDMPAEGNTYQEDDSMYFGPSAGCDSGACDSTCSSCSSCGSSFMGMNWGLGFGMGGCSSCDGGCSSCDGGCDGMCGGGCGGSACGCDEGFLCSLLAPSHCLDMLMPPMLQGSGFYIDGWIQHGFTGNPDDPDNKFNSPLAFTDRANEYMLNQVYLSFGRDVNADCGWWDLGGRVDALYGSDYFFVESLGLEIEQDGSPRWNSSNGPRRRVRGGQITEASIYGIAMPQAYAEVYAPVLDGARIKVGHFYTIIGYESVMAPENFFYSHAYTQSYGEPFTHTGALASVDWTQCWTVHAGATRGWDNWENPIDDFSFLGGLTWTSPTKRTSVSAAVHWGDEAGNNRSVYSLVFRH